MRTTMLLLCLLATPAMASAQENPLAANAKMMYGGVKMFLMASAERMPEEKYGFRPAESVRSFGQILAHAADGQMRFCSQAKGEEPVPAKFEKTAVSKADVLAALKEAAAFCDGAYANLTDATGAELVAIDGTKMPRLGVLYVNSLHSIEHYGNLVTYLRMNDLVPPSSDPALMSRVMKRPTARQ